MYEKNIIVVLFFFSLGLLTAKYLRIPAAAALLPAVTAAFLLFGRRKAAPRLSEKQPALISVCLLLFSLGMLNVLARKARLHILEEAGP